MNVEHDPFLFILSRSKIFQTSLTPGMAKPSEDDLPLSQLQKKEILTALIFVRTRSKRIPDRCFCS